MTSKMKSIFSFFPLLANERGNTITETQEEKETREAAEAAAAANQQAQQQTDWESDSNPYKKRYGDSQSQVTPLVQSLQEFAEYDQSTKTWKPKAAAPTAPVVTPTENNTFEGYDPEFVKTLEGYTKKQVDDAITKYKEEALSTHKYDSSVLESRSKALEEFGSEFDFNKDGKMNAESPLYKMADEILTTKYVELNSDGTFHKYSTPDAEYLATAEAYALLSKRAKVEAPDKGKLNAINGPGSRAAGVKKSLTYEEYRKLPTDEQDAYDLAQTGG